MASASTNEVGKIVEVPTLEGAGVNWFAITLFNGCVVDPKNDALLVGEIVVWRRRSFAFACGSVMSNNFRLYEYSLFELEYCGSFFE